MINIKDVINNVTMLSQTLPSLNIDSIFIEQDGKIEKYFYKNEQLHEKYSRDGGHHEEWNRNQMAWQRWTGC